MTLEAEEQVAVTEAIVGNTVGFEPTVTLSDLVLVGGDSGAVSFSNLDDDDIVHSVMTSSPSIGPTMLRSFYEDVCLKIDVSRVDLSPLDSSDVATTILFRNHLNSNGNELDIRLAMDGIASQNKASLSEDDFWVVYVCGTFQTDPIIDNDPDSEDEALGANSGFFGSPNTVAGIFSFEEQIKDAVLEPGAWLMSLPNARKLTISHELAHSFGIEHDPTMGNLMVAAVVSQMTDQQLPQLRLSGLAKRIIMLSRFPGRY